MPVAVVTGSNKGIGFGIVRALCKQFSGDVYLTSRDEGRGLAAVAELNKEGLQPKFHVLDIGNEDTVTKFRDFMKEKHGGIDVLVNNAGYLAKESFRELSMESIDESMAVNLKSAVRLGQASLPHLQRSDGGNIVNVSSIAGLRAWPGALAYKMSKAAMDQMTRCVALEVNTRESGDFSF